MARAGREEGAMISIRQIKTARTLLGSLEEAGIEYTNSYPRPRARGIVGYHDAAEREVEMTINWKRFEKKWAQVTVTLDIRIRGRQLPFAVTIDDQGSMSANEREALSQLRGILHEALKAVQAQLEQRP
jgi:hypothetical protein